MLCCSHPHGHSYGCKQCTQVFVHVGNWIYKEEEMYNSFHPLLSPSLFYPSWMFSSPPLVAASHSCFLYSLGNWVMKTESYISALCFQRSKCDCQVYKRLFMFSGMKWERVCGAEREKDCPARADSTAFILHATADKALVPLDRDHKSSPERCCTYSLYHSGWQTHNNPHSTALLLSLFAPPSSWDLKWWQEKVGKNTKLRAQRKKAQGKE